MMLGVLVSTFTPQDRAVRIFFHSDKRYVEKILHDEADEALKLMKGNFFGVHLSCLFWEIIRNSTVH